MNLPDTTLDEFTAGLKIKIDTIFFRTKVKVNMPTMYDIRLMQGDIVVAEIQVNEKLYIINEKYYFSDENNIGNMHWMLDRLISKFKEIRNSPMMENKYDYIIYSGNLLEENISNDWVFSPNIPIDGMMKNSTLPVTPEEINGKFI